MITVNGKKEEGQIITDLNQLELLELFVKTLPEGAKVQVTYELITGDKSYAQLSKIYKCLRDMSAYTGHTIEELKEEVKRNTGLVEGNGNLKSFRDCSKEELSAAIQNIIALGERIGLNLY